MDTMFVIDLIKKWLAHRPYGRMILAAATGTIFPMTAFSFMPPPDTPAMYLLQVLCFYTIPPTVTVLAYHGLLKRSGIRFPDGEVHCRKCDHILRGITEPRCPECGDRI